MKLFTAIYNDARLLSHFLAHYAAAAIEQFFIAVHPDLKAEAAALAANYDVTLLDDLDVTDTPAGGVFAVSEMRRRYQGPSEWVVIVDLDEFVEFPCSIDELVHRAEREHANVVRGTMWDRFSLDGQLPDVTPDSDLRQLYPVRARFIREVMGGTDYKGVLVKGLLKSVGAHHVFANEVVCSRFVEISHYKWFAGAIDRVRETYLMMVKNEVYWAIEYQRVLDHYDQNGRLAWETFGGEDTTIAYKRDKAATGQCEAAAGLADSGAASEPEWTDRLSSLVALSKTVPGWTSATDGEAIARECFALPPQAVIVEIGAFLGGSTVLLAGARRFRGSGIVHSVDPFDCSGDTFSVPHYREILESLGGGPLRRHFDENIVRAGLTDWVKVHQGRAEEIAVGWSEPIDMLLLDGDQSAEGARAAYQAWAPFLKPGGTIVLHNTGPRDYAHGHDGNRRLELEEIVSGKYRAIRQLEETTIAHKRADAATSRSEVTARRAAPRVHLFAQVWNDAFMLPYFFRHYDPFVDRYVIYDDGSTDRSREILEKHSRVEIHRFFRSDPEWFVESEQAVSNECWKESRGSADWVIVTDVDEHLYHPAMLEYLRTCADSGVTLIPALGFQMLSERLPAEGDQLCDVVRLGTPYYDLMKASIFRRDRIDEINFSFGRHQVAPTGELCVPDRDEVLLLHYKYLGVQQTHARQQALFARLGSKDIHWQLPHQYGWSLEELTERWAYLTERAIDARTVTSETYPLPRWWLPAMRTVAVAAAGQTEPPLVSADEPTPAPVPPPVSATKTPSFLYVADSIRYSPFEIEAAENFFEFRGNNLYLHPPKVGATRLHARDIVPGAASVVFTCALSLDDRSASPVVFRIRLFDASQAIWRETVVRPGEQREIRMLLDGFDGPLCAEFSTEMQAGAPSNDFAWATFYEPRLTYRPAEH